MSILIQIVNADGVILRSEELEAGQTLNLVAGESVVLPDQINLLSARVGGSSLTLQLDNGQVFINNLSPVVIADLARQNLRNFEVITNQSSNQTSFLDDFTLPKLGIDPIVVQRTNPMGVMGRATSQSDGVPVGSTDINGFGLVGIGKDIVGELPVVSVSVDALDRRVELIVENTNASAPEIMSPNALNIAENTVAGTALLTVAATDADTDAVLNYKISGGADRALFNLDSNTQVLSFIGAAPDFEAERSNKYVVDVEVSDGKYTETQSITIAVTDVNDNAPTFTSPTTKNIAENTVAGTALLTVAATDADTDAVLNYKISGGADRALFNLDSDTQVLSFIGPAPDFEAERSNKYVVDVEVSDGKYTETQSITIAVTDVNDNAPIFTSPTTKNIAENTAAGTTLLTVKATDADTDAVLTYKISGGADRALFNLDSNTRVLSFIGPAPDFEAERSNKYVVDVEVSDGKYTETQSITIAVTDVNDNMPIFTSPTTKNIAENTVAGTTLLTVAATDADAGAELTYKISGGADSALFNLDSDTQVLSFIGNAPDFEAERSSDYVVDVEVSDGKYTETQSITITVTDVNEAPTFTSPTTKRIAENTVAGTALLTVAATDADTDAVLNYKISGGADRALFVLDSNTQVLSFIGNAPDFEAERSSDYVVDVEVSDGMHTETQSITITVTDVNEAPIFTSPTTKNIAENTVAGTVLLTVEATDADAGAELTYRISGGADRALFNLDSDTQALSFIGNAPDFDVSGHDNDYVVEVEVSDGMHTETQSITITVADTAPNGKYLRLDGTNDYMQVADHDDLDIDPGKSFTFTLWVRAEAPASYDFIFDKRAGSDGAGYEGFINTAGTGQYKLILENSSGNDKLGSDYSPIAALDGDWHHIAFVVDRSAETVSLYTDGKLVSSMSHSSIGTADFSNASDLFIGSGRGAYFMEGDIDEIRIFSKAMTAAELLVDMETSLTGREAGLLAAWNFEDVDGNSVTDISGNGHNARLVNGATIVDYKPATMSFSSVELAPQTTAPANRGSIRGHTDERVILVNVKMAGELNALDINELQITLAGTEPANIDTINVYYTGKSSVLDTTTLFGTASPSTGIITINGSQTLQGGNNYFWVTYNISDSATEGEFIDATVESVTVDGSIETPVSTEATGSSLILSEHSILWNPGDDGSHRYRIPALTTALDGSLIAAVDKRYLGGDLRGNDEDIDIVVKRSTDGGKTWSEAVTLADFGARDFGAREGASDPLIITDKITGDILVLYLAYNGVAGSRPTDRARTFVSRSKDNGATWLAPVEITNDIYPDGWHLVWATSGSFSQTRDGRMIAVVAARRAAFGGFPALTNHLIYSDDGGYTWDIYTGTPPRSGAPYGDESKVVELDDGRLYMSMRDQRRSGNHRRISHSDDGGQSWTTSVRELQLPDPTNNADLIRYTSVNDGFDKSRILFSNTNNPNERKNLYLYMSEDEGETWAYKKQIYAGDSQYSSLTVLPNGDIGILYESNEFGEQEMIIFARVSLDWLTGGEHKYTPPKEAEYRASVLTGDQGFIIQGDVARYQKVTDYTDEADDSIGLSVSRAGDVNGDGIDDLIVGAPGSDGYIGAAYVIFGKNNNGFGTAVDNGAGTNRQLIDLSSLTAAQGFIIQGDAADDQAGYSVSSAGDVNGDGYDDLIIGAYQGDDGGVDAGEAYVVFGKKNGFGTEVETNGNKRQVIDLTSLTAADGFIIQGDAADDQAGYSVSSAGDVNGDGYDDLIIGAPHDDAGGVSAGAAYVVFGKAAGFGTAVDNGAGTNRQVIDLTSLTADQGFIIQGDAAGDQAGYSVSLAGDVNGDGYDDLIVGAYQGNDGGVDAGAAYVVFGKAAEFGTAVDNGVGTNRQVIDLTSLTADQGFIIQGDATMDKAGVSVSSAGDVNGDGYDDLIIGAYQGDDGGIDAGEAYVVFGKAAGFGTAVNNGADTNRQVIDVASLTADQGFIIQGGTYFDKAGYSVSSAGDVNGDGFDDLIIGAHSGNGNGLDVGTAYVVFGKADGFGSSDADGRAVIDLSSLTAVDGFVIQSNTRNKATAVSVSAVGDVNDDGFDDLIVGAYQGGDAGEAYVIFGKAMPGGTASVNTTGDTSAETLIGGAGNDNLTGGGGADVLRGGAGDDVLGVADTTFRRIDGGTGNDILRIDGSGITLDFTNLLPNKVSGVELIDLTGSGANALELDIRDLLDISDDTQDGTTILRVLGDADDAVRTADSGWIKGDNVNIGGQDFHQFDNGNARLLVDTDVDINGVLG